MAINFSNEHDGVTGPDGVLSSNLNSNSKADIYTVGLENISTINTSLEIALTTRVFQAIKLASRRNSLSQINPQIKFPYANIYIANNVSINSSFLDSTYGREFTITFLKNVNVTESINFLIVNGGEFGHDAMPTGRRLRAGDTIAAGSFLAADSPFIDHFAVNITKQESRSTFLEKISLALKKALFQVDDGRFRDFILIENIYDDTGRKESNSANNRTNLFLYFKEQRIINNAVIHGNQAPILDVTFDTSIGVNVAFNDNHASALSARTIKLSTEGVGDNMFHPFSVNQSALFQEGINSGVFSFKNVSLLLWGRCIIGPTSM